MTSIHGGSTIKGHKFKKHTYEGSYQSKNYFYAHIQYKWDLNTYTHRGHNFLTIGYRTIRIKGTNERDHYKTHINGYCMQVTKFKN